MRYFASLLPYPRKLLAFICIACIAIPITLLATSCTGEDCDPDLFGTYFIDIDWVSDAGPQGICGVDDPPPQVFAVTKGRVTNTVTDLPMNLVVTGVPGVVVQGFIRDCSLHLVYRDDSVDPTPDPQHFYEIDELVADTDRNLVGHGNLDLRGLISAPECTQPFVISGRIEH